MLIFLEHSIESFKILFKEMGKDKIKIFFFFYYIVFIDAE
jgi:hypothetical protein